MAKLKEPSPEGDRIRAAILRASVRLGRERGGDGLTMRALAARVGLSAATMYQQLADKEAILAAVRMQALREIEARMVAAAEAARKPVDGLVAACVAWVDFARSDPWLYRVLTGGGTRHVAEATEWNDGVQRLVERGARWVRAARATTSTGQRDDENVVVSLWCIAHGLALAIVDRGAGPDRPLFAIENDRRFAETVLRRSVVAALTATTNV